MESFSPSLGWGNELATSVLWVAKAWVIGAVCTVIVLALDESTSALDEGQEFALYRALRTALPDCIVVSISHRATVEQHHDRRLELLAGGEWRLVPV